MPTKTRFQFGRYPPPTGNRPARQREDRLFSARFIHVWWGGTRKARNPRNTLCTSVPRCDGRWHGGGGTRSVPGVSGTPHFRYGGSRMRTDSLPISQAGFFQVLDIAVTLPGFFKQVWRYPFQSSPARPLQSSRAAKCPASCRCAAGVGVPAVH